MASQQPYLLTYVKLFILCIVLTILDNSEVSWYLTCKCVDNRYPMIVCIVYLLYVQSLFEAIFGNVVLRPLFITADNSLHEWHFRWRLDRYVSSCRQVTLLTTAL